MDIDSGALFEETYQCMPASQMLHAPSIRDSVEYGNKSTITHSNLI